jgi:hypothetical protein
MVPICITCHLHTYIHTYIHIHTDTWKMTHIYKNTHTYTHTYIHTYMQNYAHVQNDADTRAHTLMSEETAMQMCTYTHACMHPCSSQRMRTYTSNTCMQACMVLCVCTCAATFNKQSHLCLYIHAHTWYVLAMYACTYVCMYACMWTYV